MKIVHWKTTENEAYVFECASNEQVEAVGLHVVLEEFQDLSFEQLSTLSQEAGAKGYEDVYIHHANVYDLCKRAR